MSVVDPYFELFKAVVAWTSSKLTIIFQERGKSGIAGPRNEFRLHLNLVHLGMIGSLWDFSYPLLLVLWCMGRHGEASRKWTWTILWSGWRLLCWVFHQLMTYECRNPPDLNKLDSYCTQRLAPVIRHCTRTDTLRQTSHTLHNEIFGNLVPVRSPPGYFLGIFKQEHAIKQKLHGISYQHECGRLARMNSRSNGHNGWTVGVRLL